YVTPTENVLHVFSRLVREFTKMITRRIPIQLHLISTFLLRVPTIIPLLKLKTSRERLLLISSFFPASTTFSLLSQTLHLQQSQQE
ncbi:hypothetical protein Moror_11736, partial [Moniliophthora roreri MCA 2997]